MQETFVIALVVAALVGALASLIATLRQTRKSQAASASSASPAEERARLTEDISIAVASLKQVVDERLPLITGGTLPEGESTKLCGEIETAVSTTVGLLKRLKEFDAHEARGHREPRHTRS